MNTTAEVPTKYRAQLVLANGTALTLAHNDKKVLQRSIENIFSTQQGLTPQQQAKPLIFTENDDNGWTVITHESHANGKYPISCIAEVPDVMDVQNVVVDRFRSQRAA